MAYKESTREYYDRILTQIKNEGLFKEERYICSPQAAHIKVEYPPKAPEKAVLNFCANNYLGL